MTLMKTHKVAMADYDETASEQSCRQPRYLSLLRDRRLCVPISRWVCPCVVGVIKTCHPRAGNGITCESARVLVSARCVKTVARRNDCTAASGPRLTS